MREVGASRRFAERVLPWWVHHCRASNGLALVAARSRAGRGGSCRGGVLAKGSWLAVGCAARRRNPLRAARGIVGRRELARPVA
eukprot:4359212-Heterocapsa_arctica.AAC.1